MSKMKDELERIRQREYDEYVSFMEWVCDQDIEESVTGENEVEERTDVPSTVGISILPANALNYANNSNYNPKQGA